METPPPTSETTGPTTTDSTATGTGIGDTSYPIPGGSDKDYHPIGGIQPHSVLEAEKIADFSESGVGDWITTPSR